MIVSLYVLILWASAAVAAPIPFTGVYTQNFDSMGTAGTAAPAGWTVYNLTGSHEDFSFWTAAGGYVTHLPSDTPTAINVGPGTDTLTAVATLTAVTGPTNQKAAVGYNLGLSASSSDRALGTSPTGNAAMELQLVLANNTGADINSFNISYDIRRFTTTADNNTGYDAGPDKGIEELPGYWLFYSLDGGATFTNVASLDPTLAGPNGIIVPNSVGVTNVPQTTVTLGGLWTNGGNLTLRWLDDNAESPSPDQILGLDNVSVTQTPEPATMSLLAVGALALIRRRRAV
jgi:MYXO-CTERM domain-containing protein